MAVLLIGAAMPWYALRALPVLTRGAAAVNVLDMLVGCAVLLSMPRIAEALRRRDLAVLAVLVFLAYMIVPFLLGPLRDPSAWFYTVREARALAFYSLAAALAAGGYSAFDYRRFAAVYVAGAVIASVAVGVHLLWRVPLPGYPAMIASAPEAKAGIIARYLEWTVPVVAFMFSLVGTIQPGRWPVRIAWAAATCCIVWYLVTMHERTPEGVAFALAIAVILLPSLGGLTWRRAAVAAASLAVIVGLGYGIVPGPYWIRYPAEQMVRNWHQVGGGDQSIRIRLKEMQSAVPSFRSHPLFGMGLGGVVSTSAPDFPTGPWRYLASGFGYLLVKTGLIGLALFIGMVAIAVANGWRMIRAGREAGGWPQWSIAMLGMAALMTLNLSHTVADIPEGAIAFSLFYGMLVARESGAAPN